MGSCVPSLSLRNLQQISAALMYQHAWFGALCGFLYIRAPAKQTARTEEGKKEVTEIAKAASVACTQPVCSSAVKFHIFHSC